MKKLFIILSFIGTVFAEPLTRKKTLPHKTGQNSIMPLSYRDYNVSPEEYEYKTRIFNRAVTHVMSVVSWFDETMAGCCDVEILPVKAFLKGDKAAFKKIKGNLLSKSLFFNEKDFNSFLELFLEIVSFQQEEGLQKIYSILTQESQEEKTEKIVALYDKFRFIKREVFLKVLKVDLHLEKVRHFKKCYAVVQEDQKEAQLRKKILSQLV
ncbi:MAG: hypothetical protein WD068_00675 [Candidatus Babeliales bacterium]